MYGRCRSSKQPSASIRARSARRARRAFMSVAAAAVAAAIWAWSKYMPIRAAARVTVLRGLPSSREIFDADQSLPCMTRIFMSSVSESAGPLPIACLRPSLSIFVCFPLPRPQRRQAHRERLLLVRAREDVGHVVDAEPGVELAGIIRQFPQPPSDEIGRA